MTDFDPVNLLRSVIRNLQPFSSARGEASDLMTRSNWIWMDANENPWPPMGDFATQCRANRYPEPQPSDLKNILASLYGIAPERLLLCRGSEDIPDLLVRCFCQPGRDGVVVCPPTFGMYEIATSLNESPLRRVALRSEHGYDLDVESILRGWQSHEKLIFIASPAVPLGHLMPEAQIEALLEALAGKAIVILDEAYVEFSNQPSWLTRLSRYPNLFVLRTLSKAYALAGVRLGILFATADLVAKLEGVLPPYPIPAPTIEVIKQALTPEGLALLADRRQIIIQERQRLAKILVRHFSIRKVFPSDSNFLLLQTDDAVAFVKHCRKNGLIVRNRHSDLENTVRITIGKPEENDRLLHALELMAGGKDQ